MKDCTKAFHNFSANGLHLRFPNGNFISTIFGRGSYSDNYNRNFLNTKEAIEAHDKFMESDTVEIMFDCGKILEKKILRRHDTKYQPLGHLSVKQWEKIVHEIATEKFT